MLSTDLIGAPYTPPQLKHGARAFCLYRDCEVRITTWTDAPISWPRCNAIGVQGGSGLLVNYELLRAIRTESAAAIKHWFGVGTNAVWNWRRAFGIQKWGSEGSKRLKQQTAERAWAATKGKPIPEAIVEKRMQTRQKNGTLGVPNAKDWTADEIALLGTQPDLEVSARIGRSHQAVRRKRKELGILTPRQRARASQRS